MGAAPFSSCTLPLTATSVGSRRNARHRSTIVQVLAQHPGSKDSAETSRRSVAALFAVSPIVLAAPKALALIPDDDDEELVEKARANRKARLASERRAEKAFTRSEGFVNKAEQKDLVPVQRAINSLALTGKQLADGEVSAAASTLNAGWSGDFEAAAKDLSFDAAAKDSVARVFSDLKALQSAAQKGSLSDAKSGYVALVGSIQDWTSRAGISSSLTGI